MKRAPYSLPEAQRLCTDYSHLVGQPFGRGSDAIIESVVVAPFDEASRKRFLIFYFLFNNAESALSQEYKGLLFDVLVIARSVTDEHELQQLDLHAWLGERKTTKERELMIAEDIQASLN